MNARAVRLLGDVALAVGVGVAGVGSDLVMNGAVPMVLLPEVPWRGVWIQAVAALMLLARRRHPMAVAVAMLPLGYAELPLAMPFALYSLGAHQGDRRRVIVLAALWLAVLSHLWEPRDLTTTVHLLSICGLAVIPASVLGLYIDSRRRLDTALAEKAAREARAEERTRLAREVHDVVTHHVSLMVLQAGSLRMAAPDEEVRQAAEEIRATGRRALGELREVVGVLRDSGPAELAPQPTLLDVSRLVAESGLRVRLRQDAGLEVSAALGRTAYRVVQEALTNVRKHAPGAEVDVRLSGHEGGVRVAVGNPAGQTSGAFPASGTGLLGLRQRVELVGGAFSAGWTGSGRFELVAVLPGQGAAA
ncbi:sensor histidine kinase [Nonomuraea typhae]|uniref:histidine kinase n=1 Tax=Nonomuraea typhae TaxID=2603600 RepID=A0ABW7ZDU0_9ACTN